MNIKTKIIIVLIAVLFINFSDLIIADEYKLVCLKKGETIDYRPCNPRMGTYTCDGFCQTCVHEIREGVYCSTGLDKCYSFDLSCSYLGSSESGIESDSAEPIIEINGVIQNQIINSRSLYLGIELNEPAEISYLDNSDNSRWKTLCRNCNGYSRKRTFKEGLNNLTIKAVDSFGNEAYKDLIFFIDSKNPRITKTQPKKGFADGVFEVEFREENPSSLILYYGNYQTGMKTKEINLNAECIEERISKKCNTFVNLDEFNNQEIEYYFELEDISGNKHNSRLINLKVDTINPILISSNTEIQGRRVNFKMQINEENFDEVVYKDLGDKRYRRLCSKLSDGLCDVTRTFSRGLHELDIKIKDKAGNEYSISQGFEIE